MMHALLMMIAAVDVTPVAPPKPAVSGLPRTLTDVASSTKREPDEQVGAVALSRAMAQRDPAARLTEMDLAIAKLPRPTPFRGVTLCFRADTLLNLRRVDEAQLAADECQRLRGREPLALWTQASVQALGGGDPKIAARTMLSAIALFPEQVAATNAGMFDMLTARLTRAGATDEARDVRIAIARAGVGQRDPLAGSRSAFAAVQALVSQGETQEAVKLLPQILDTTLGLQLLTDRRYEAIWPQVEEWAGGDLVAQRDSLVRATGALYEAEPVLKRRMDHAGAINAAGRSADALALMLPAIEDRANWDAPRIQIADFAGRAARLLDELGRSDEAVALLKRVRTDPGTVGKPGEILIVPVEATILINAGRAPEALALAEASRAKSVRGGPGAMRMIDAFALCARYAMKHDIGATRTAMLGAVEGVGGMEPLVISCTEDFAAARTYYLKRLANPMQSGATLRFLSNPTERPDQLNGYGWDAMMPRLAADPAIAAKVAAMTRPLPASFIPAARRWNDYQGRKRPEQQAAATAP